MVLLFVAADAIVRWLFRLRKAGDALPGVAPASGLTAT
jgi:hypothetical protein